MARRARATIKIKRVHFYRAHGGHVEMRQDPSYGEAIGEPDLHVVEPDLLRYDLAFVHEDGPTLVAFPVFSNYYGAGEPTLGLWRSHLHRITREHKTGEIDPKGWYTFRNPLLVDGRIDYSRLVKVPLTAFLLLHRSQHPQDVMTVVECPECFRPESTLPGVPCDK